MHQDLKLIEHIQIPGKRKFPNIWHGFKLPWISSGSALHSLSSEWFTVYVIQDVSQRKRGMSKSVSFHQCVTEK
jgi:hypothetical protein